MKKRLLYFCSYVPVDVLEKAGFEMVNIHELTAHPKGRSGLSASSCSFIRYFCDIPYETYDGIIFVNCCNSSQRMYDYVRYHYPNVFACMLELPTAKDDIWNYEELIHTLNEHFGCYIRLGKEKNSPPETYQWVSEEKENLLILSSAVQQEYVKELKDLFDEYSCLLITCSSEKRGMKYLKGEEVSCPRRLNYFSYIEKKIKNVSGVIVILQKNCDPILFASSVISKMCQEKKISFLLVEEEYAIKISSRSRLRYEAFLEELEVGRRKHGK